MREVRTGLDERGATIAFLAVSMVAMLAMLALAVDLGMLFKARSDAQRAADAGALAGASAFLDNPDPVQDTTQARIRAKDFATRNSIMGTPIDTSAVQVTVEAGQRKVRVRVARAGVSTWFANLFGQAGVDVNAKAAAQVSPATTATCVKPSAVRDLWNDQNQDVNHDHIWNWQPPNNEVWHYDNGEAYSAASTGWGSSFRNGFGSGTNRKSYDFGRQAVLVEVGSSGNQGNPSSFNQAWGFAPSDESASKVAQRVTQCDTRPVSVGDNLRALNGNKLGQVADAWDQLAASDPGLSWDDVNNKVAGTSNTGSWETSPRVVTVMLFNPSDVQSSSDNTITAGNFARFFLEQRACSGNGNCKAPVTGRFLGFVVGTAGGGSTGTLIKTLQLVE